MVLTPRTCCWAGRAAAREAVTAEALTKLMAEVKLRLWTAGEASWRPNGERRAFEKLREAIAA